MQNIADAQRGLDEAIDGSSTASLAHKPPALQVPMIFKPERFCTSAKPDTALLGSLEAI
jgi:hypothetical protein